MAVKLKEDGKYRNLYLKDVLLWWAKVHKPEKDDFGNNQYSVTVFVTEEDKEALEDLAVNKQFAQVDKTKLKKGPNRGQIKFSSEKYEGTEGMYGFNLTLSAERRDGAKNTPPTVVLFTGERKEDGSKIHKFLKEPIGNGTKANIRCSVYTTKVDPDALCLNLNLIEVLELVEYQASTSIKDDEFGISVDLSDAEAEDFDDVPPFDADEAEEDDDY